MVTFRKPYNPAAKTQSRSFCEKLKDGIISPRFFHEGRQWFLSIQQQDIATFRVYLMHWTPQEPQQWIASPKKAVIDPAVGAPPAQQAIQQESPSNTDDAWSPPFSVVFSAQNGNENPIVKKQKNENSRDILHLHPHRSFLPEIGPMRYHFVICLAKLNALVE